MTEAERIKELEERLKFYETNGSARLFYSLNKKMNEMAEMLNRHNLTNIDISAGSDKTFDRLKIVWQDAASIANAVEALGRIAGITNNEKEDTGKPIYRAKQITPESIADSIGELAGKRTQ